MRTSHLQLLLTQNLEADGDRSKSGLHGKLCRGHLLGRENPSVDVWSPTWWCSSQPKEGTSCNLFAGKIPASDIISKHCHQWGCTTFLKILARDIILTIWPLMLTFLVLGRCTSSLLGSPTSEIPTTEFFWGYELKYRVGWARRLILILELPWHTPWQIEYLDDWHTPTTYDVYRF